MEQVKYRGVAFEYGDEILIVPPLSTRQLEEHAEELDSLQEIRGKTLSLKETLAFLSKNIFPAVLSALQRNYPDMNMDKVKDFVTTENWGRLTTALLGNNVKDSKVKVGEAFPAVLPGEQASTPSNLPKSNGSISEPASPLLQDGPGSTSLKM